MKYKNNHFGQVRIFGQGNCKLPMNLQMFAESETTTGTGSGNGDADNSNSDPSSKEDTPSVEELLAQLAAERAKSAKLQNEKDNASSEAANFKKQLRQKMSADEQAEAAKAEAEAAKDAKIRELESKFRVMDYSKRFMGVGMEETAATELAGMAGELAEPDKFFSALDKFVKAAIKKAGDDRVEELTRNNPSIAAGNGDADKESEAVRIARESAARRSGKKFDEGALKQWM